MSAPKTRPKRRTKRETPWKEVSRQRVFGGIRVSPWTDRGGSIIKVTYRVMEKRHVNGILEVRWVEDVRTLQSHDAGNYLLVETVARLLPHIEAGVFDRIEEKEGYIAAGFAQDLVRDPMHKDLIKAPPIAKAILGPDRF